MDFSEKISRLCALRNRGVKFGIDRMRLLAEALNSPQKAFPSIHLAGTNGKGSTAAMLERILRAHGLARVGLFTSPHLLKLGERVQINRVPMSDTEICAAADALLDVSARFGKPGDDDFPSFFEIMTAMAFCRFARERVDAAVIETGLGGRLDATNVITPRVSVITSIGFDHTEILGATLAQIAREKAGIIKPRVPVVLGIVPAEAEHEIRKIAHERQAQVFSVREIFPDENAFPRTNLAGAHQRRNAALAIVAAKLFFGKNFDEIATHTALGNVEWRARWEKIPLADGREIILDVAHNEEGAQACDASLGELFAQTVRKPRIVTGILGTARARPLIAVFAKHARELIFVRPEQDRACSFAELESCVPADFAGTVREAAVAELFPAKNRCSIATPDGEPIVVAGSCYLAGEVLAALTGTRVDSALQDKLPAFPPPK